MAAEFTVLEQFLGILATAVTAVFGKTTFDKRRLNGNGIKPLGETGVELAIRRHKEECQAHMIDEFTKIRDRQNVIGNDVTAVKGSVKNVENMLNMVLSAEKRQ